MKNVYFLLCSLMLIGFSLKSKAQGVSKSVDSRIYKHWSTADIEEMQKIAPKELKKIEYILNRSWRFADSTTLSTGPNNTEIFDVYDYNNARKEHEDVLIYLKLTSGRAVYLQSWDTVRKAFTEL